MENVPNKKLPIDAIVMDTMGRAELSTQASNILTGRNFKSEEHKDTHGIKTENGLILGNLDGYQCDPYYYMESEKELFTNIFVNDKNFISSIFSSIFGHTTPKNSEIPTNNQDLPYEQLLAKFERTRQ